MAKQIYYETCRGALIPVKEVRRVEDSPAPSARGTVAKKVSGQPWEAGEEITSSPFHFVVKTGFRGCYQMVRQAKIGN